MRAMKLAICLVLAAANTEVAFAGGLFAPISMDSAAVLPKGIRNVRLTNFSTEIFDKYDGSGSVVPLANSFNKNVMWKELIAARPDEFERGQLTGGLRAEGIEMDEVAGRAHGLINARMTSTVPVVAYGLTPKITIGVGVPVIYSNVNIDTGWTAGSQFNDRLAQLMSVGYAGRILKFRDMLNNVVATKIQSYGYKPLVGEQKTEVGDVNVVAKYQFYNEGRWAFAVAPKLVLPTGRRADIDKVVDIAPGDGQPDVGVGLVGDFTANKSWTFTASAGFTYQIAMNQAARIPLNGDETISPDIDPNVRKKLGNVSNGAVAAKYKINDLMTASTAYSLQYKEADSYEGSKYESSRYRFLEEDTWQNMQAVQLAFTASTIPLFRAGVFPIPLDGTLSLARVFEGRNVGKIDLAVFELAAYF